jgi:processive 1,2-diacylglycerol beta-glucosyltransferase
MKKIVYLSADFGQGHKSTVKAIQEALDKYYPGQFEYQVIDIAGILSPLLDKTIQFLYDKSVAYAKPSYKAFFEITDRIGKKDADKAYYPIIKSSLKPIADANPDIVIQCYPLLSYSVKRSMEENGVKAPLFVQITDTGEVHINWVSDKVDHYFTETYDTAFYLQDKGIKKERISTFGFPVKQFFYQQYSFKKTRAKFGLTETDRVILIFPGAQGAGRVMEKVHQIDQQNPNVKLLIVTGSNERLAKALKKEKFGNKIKIFGFVENMAELISTADLIVSKAGGISVMEIITMKKPLIITEINPGQEEPNARFIESMGFGYVEKDPVKLGKKVKYVLEHDLPRLQDNMNHYHLNEHSDKKLAEFIHSAAYKKVPKEGFIARVFGS